MPVKMKVGKPLKMSDELFAQRKRIMGFLYEARKLSGTMLPYIQVRIVEFKDNPGLAGVSYTGKDSIAIASNILGMSDDQLRLVVWHELAHAYFNAKHDDSCPLMHPLGGGKVYTKDVLSKAFKRIATKGK